MDGTSTPINSSQTDSQSQVVESTPSSNTTNVPISFTRKVGIVAIFVVLLSALAWFLYTNRAPAPEYSPEDEKALEVTKTGVEETYTQKGYKDYLKELDDQLANSNLSSKARNLLLYRKALMMVEAQETDEISREKLRLSGMVILNDLYKSPETDEQTLQLKAAAALQFVIYYNNKNWEPSDAYFLPNEYGNKYSHTVNTAIKAGESPAIQDTTNKYDRLAYQEYVEFLQEPNLNKYLGNDITFVSNKAYLLGSYLDTYYDSMDADEKKAVSEELKNTLLKFSQAGDIILHDKIHTRLLADFYYAYAYDMYVKRVGDDAFDKTKVSTNYETARANVDVTKDFIQSNAVMGQYIDLYYLNYLLLSKAPDEKINAIIAEMSSYADKEDSAKVLWYWFRTLFTRRKESSLAKAIAPLSKNKNFAAYVKKIQAADPVATSTAATSTPAGH